MKNLLLFYVVLSLFTLSCSEESSTPEEPLPPEELPLSESIIGNWVWNSFKVECENPEYNIPLLNVDENNCINIEETITCDFILSFTSDNMVMASITNDGNTNTAALTFSVDDSTNTFDLCIEDGTEQICQNYRVNDGSFEYIEDEGDCKGIYNFVKS